MTRQSKKSTPLVSKDYIICNSIPVPESGCWLWLGRVNVRGYGYPRVVDKVGHLAHRLSYKAFKGPFEEDLNVNHICDVRCCVNPDHLYTGTQQENVEDRVSRNRSAKMTGMNNPRYDTTRYTFTNNISKEVFTGTRFDFQNLYDVDQGTLSKMCSGKNNTYKGWRITNKE